MNPTPYSALHRMGLHLEPGTTYSSAMTIYPAITWATHTVLHRGTNTTLTSLKLSSQEKLPFSQARLKHITNRNETTKKQTNATGILLETITTRILPYSISRKTVNTIENFWNVYCFATNQMRDETTGNTQSC